jgi:hypothetical protein
MKGGGEIIPIIDSSCKEPLVICNSIFMALAVAARDQIEREGTLGSIIFYCILLS